MSDEHSKFVHSFFFGKVVVANVVNVTLVLDR